MIMIVMIMMMMSREICFFPLFNKHADHKESLCTKGTYVKHFPN